MVSNPLEKTIAGGLYPAHARAPPLLLAAICRFHYADRCAYLHPMGHRLSKIVTRTGDAGTTGLGDGTRIAKDSVRIEAIGAVDELNSTLGVLAAEILPVPIAACILDVQHDLFDLGGE